MFRFEAVAICDRFFSADPVTFVIRYRLCRMMRSQSVDARWLFILGTRKPKCKVDWKPAFITANCPIEHSCGDAVNRSEICIEHDLLITNCDNPNSRCFVLRGHDVNLSFSLMLASRHIGQGLAVPIRQRKKLRSWVGDYQVGSGCGRILRPVQISSAASAFKVAVCDLKPLLGKKRFGRRPNLTRQRHVLPRIDPFASVRSAVIC